MKIKQSILIACGCLSLLPGASFADPERATVLIENQTGKRVTYQFRWGADAPWKDFVLQPGFNTTHRKQNDPKGVPPPFINVATAPGFEGPLFKKYKLNIGWDNKPRKYHFAVKDNKVDLFSD
jgi:hypothetical protein